MGRVLKDFHVVETHRHWLRVGRAKLRSCELTCDRFVQQWVCTKKEECKAVAGNALIRSQFQASIFGGGNGFLVKKCGACLEITPQMKAAQSSTQIGGINKRPEKPAESILGRVAFLREEMQDAQRRRDVM